MLAPHPSGERGDDHWAEGLADVRAATAEGLELLYSEFNPGERSVLRAVAQSGTVYGAEADLLDLSKGTALMPTKAPTKGTW